MITTVESTTLQHYPELQGELTGEQWESIARGYHTPFAHDEEAAWKQETRDWIDSRIVTRSYGERALRVFVDTPAEADNRKVMVALGEFGNGLTDPAIHRARIVRDAVSPESTMLLMPNDSYEDTNNLDLTHAERKQLLNQEATPLVRRLQALVEGFEDVSIFAPSQGATVGAAFGADKFSPTTAIGAIEAPNVVRRPNRLFLAKDFGGSASHLVENIKINAPQDDSLIVENHAESITALGNVRYGLGIMLPANLAIAGLMKNNDFGFDARRTLERGGSVSHLWTAQSLVSPDAANTRIAEKLASYDTYSALRLQGEIADHSSTNVAAVCVAAMNRAMRR